jgi:hypothetical protein
MNRALPRWLTLLVIGTLVVGTTWPMWSRLGASIPQGTESAATVPVFNLWTVGWNLQRVRHGWQSYWEAPHFHPTPHALALSEPICTSQLLFGLSWLPLPVAYNVFLLGGLTLNVVATWWVLSRQRVAWPVALLASWMMLRLPFVHWQLGMLQAVFVGGIIGTIHFAADAVESCCWKRLWWAALCFNVTWLTCGYYGLFLAMLMPMLGSLGFIAWVRRHRSQTDSTRLRRGLIGAILIVSLIVPLVWFQSRVLSNPSFERPRDVIQNLSAQPSDYLVAKFPEWCEFLGFSRGHDPARWKLSPGILKFTLALCGIVVGLRSRRRRIGTATWLLMSLGAFLISLGPNLRIGGWAPYAMLLDWFAPLTRVRTLARMAVIVQIGAVFLSAEALNWGFRVARIRGRRQRTITCWQRWPLGLCWAIGLVACFEVSLPSMSFVPVPTERSQQRWIGWLKQHTDPTSIIAHVPFPIGPSVRDYEEEAWAMYWSLFHERRIVNGYSGFFPPSYLELKSHMQSFPDDRSFASLRSRGVTHIVASQSFVERSKLLSESTASEQLELTFHDEVAQVSVFRLR